MYRKKLFLFTELNWQVLMAQHILITYGKKIEMIISIVALHPIFNNINNLRRFSLWYSQKLNKTNSKDWSLCDPYVADKGGKKKEWKCPIMHTWREKLSNGIAHTHVCSSMNITTQLRNITYRVHGHLKWNFYRKIVMVFLH